MKLRFTDFVLSRIAQHLSSGFKRLGDMESRYLADRLDKIVIDRPVFITGLARSGTTILLNQFASVRGVGTHRYRDFPFLFTPYWWNRFNERFGQVDVPIERPHKDRIIVTGNSPDAFEEPLWTHFFPFVHDPSADHLLTTADNDVEFNAFFKEHIRKILLIRGKDRYVSKGNYNISRLDYIANILPNALFLIPIRHPVDHVNSLVRQHQLFTQYSVEDHRVPAYLRAVGHFEFGPQRSPINLDREDQIRVLDAWSQGEDHLGYAITWKIVYRHVKQILAENVRLAERIKIVRYEGLCANPISELTDIFEFCGLADQAVDLLLSQPDISAPRHEQSVEGRSDRDLVWQETAEVAQFFDYQRNRQENGITVQTC